MLCGIQSGEGYVCSSLVQDSDHEDDDKEMESTDVMPVLRREPDDSCDDDDVDFSDDTEEDDEHEVREQSVEGQLHIKPSSNTTTTRSW